VNSEIALQRLGLDPCDGVAQCPLCDRPYLNAQGAYCTNGCKQRDVAARLVGLARLLPPDDAADVVAWAEMLELDAVVTVTSMSEVEAKPVSWLWPGRIPAGMIGVLDGPPGMGKSSVVLDLVARITTGRPWPASVGNREPRDVVLLGHEDSAEHTTRPRLDAAKADPARVHLIESIRGRLPELPTDVGDIERIIVAHSAVMLVIDPVSAYLAGADLHRDNDIRSALAPLAVVAERTGCAILLLRHLRKSGGVDALYRGLGSVAITALARVAMMLLADPDNEEARVLTWPKLSVGPHPTSLRWTFKGGGLDAPPTVEWDSTPCSFSAQDILDREDARGREPSSLDRAVAWLREALADGPVASKELQKRSEAEGISAKTFERARERLAVHSVRDGHTRTWVSSLPSKIASVTPRRGSDGLGDLGGLREQERQDSQDRQKPTLGKVGDLAPGLALVTP